MTLGDGDAGYEPNANGPVAPESRSPLALLLTLLKFLCGAICLLGMAGAFALFLLGQDMLATNSSGPGGLPGLASAISWLASFAALAALLVAAPFAIILAAIVVSFQAQTARVRAIADGVWMVGCAGGLLVAGLTFINFPFPSEHRRGPTPDVVVRAEYGDLDAQMELGLWAEYLLRNAPDGTQPPGACSEGIRWFRRAAIRDDRAGQCHLARIYQACLAGRPELTAPLVYLWYRMAADNPGDYGEDCGAEDVERFTDETQLDAEGMAAIERVAAEVAAILRDPGLSAGERVDAAQALIGQVEFRVAEAVILDGQYPGIRAPAGSSDPALP